MSTTRRTETRHREQQDPEQTGMRYGPNIPFINPPPNPPNKFPTPLPTPLPRLFMAFPSFSSPLGSSMSHAPVPTAAAPPTTLAVFPSFRLRRLAVLAAPDAAPAGFLNRKFTKPIVMYV